MTDLFRAEHRPTRLIFTSLFDALLGVGSWNAFCHAPFLNGYDLVSKLLTRSQLVLGLILASSPHNPPLLLAAI